MDFIDQIKTELARAEKLHPHWPSDIIHAAAIVAEESGEMIREAVRVTYEGGDIKDLEKELIQTAATCLRMLNTLR